MSTFVTPLIEHWQQARAELAAIERAEHRDIIDGYGRAWRWRGRGDLYSHDSTLALPADWIKDYGLPPAALASNPNYSRLCDVCRQHWPSEAQDLYARVRALRSACAICHSQLEVNEWSKAMPYECRPDGLWEYAHFDCRERALRGNTPA